MKSKGKVLYKKKKNLNLILLIGFIVCLSLNANESNVETNNKKTSLENEVIVNYILKTNNESEKKLTRKEKAEKKKIEREIKKAKRKKIALEKKAKKAMNRINKEFNKDNIEKGVKLLKKEIETNEYNVEAKILYSNFTCYEQALDSYNQGDLENSKIILETFDKSYIQKKLNKLVEELITNIEIKEQEQFKIEQELFDKELNSIEEKINNEKYQEADEILIKVKENNKKAIGVERIQQLENKIILGKELLKAKGKKEEESKINISNKNQTNKNTSKVEDNNGDKRKYYIAEGNRYYHNNSGCKFIKGGVVRKTTNISGKFPCNCIK